MKYEIIPYAEENRNILLEIWEESVRKSHHFLEQNDFEEIKKLVQQMNFLSLHVYFIRLNQQSAGFIGILEHKIEMLFIHPSYFNQGLGSELVLFAEQQFDAFEVDVNEQNTRAIQFYRKHGYLFHSRSEKDGQGRNYPILTLKKLNHAQSFK